MAPRLKTLLYASVFLALSLPLIGACSSKDAATEAGNTAGPTTGAGAGTGVCLLNSCSADNQCDGCADGRNKCLVKENRCVACDPGTGQGCKPGESCSSFGLCVPQGLTCPVDNMGNPTVKCTKNADCKACDPQHQVCDDKAGKCQSCTDTNTQHCLASDRCLNGQCSPKCPKACSANGDCSECGTAPNVNHFCFNHKCAQCQDDTHGCDAAKGEKCVEGKCTPPCGLVGPVAGTCTAKEDCQYCGDPKASTKWDCKFPVNDNKHGTCTPPANGCSDLGKNVVVLPAPYDQFTQTCSSDMDCTQAKAGIQFNIGKVIRDLVGTDTINVGITKVKINDANVTYNEPICAKVSIKENLSCGICVPCKEDKDCAPIPVNPIIVDLFKGDALATLAGVILVQTLWGKDNDPKLNFYCQQVVGGFGACLPCANPTAVCGKQGGGGDMGMCDHPVCKMGGALKSSCGDCAKSVCSNDSYCCDTTWDDLCVKEADQYCNNVCSGNNCPHNACTEGDKLDTSCSPCAADVCKDDSFCCATKWDSQCVTEAKDTKTYPSCQSACGAGCAHDPCAAGGKLVKGCSNCTTAVCGKDTYCCDTEWDATCVGEAKAEASCGCK